MGDSDTDGQKPVKAGSGRKPTGRLRKSFTLTWPEELWQQVNLAAKSQGVSRWLHNLAETALKEIDLKG